MTVRKQNPKTKIEKLLLWLQGKKVTILTILALFVTYLLDSGSIDSGLAYLLNGILVAVGYTASTATREMYKKK